MGLLLVDQSADFSAVAVGHAGLYTSLTTGLQALHETRRNNAKTISNSAPGKEDAAVQGVIPYTAVSAQVTSPNSVLFSNKPASGGLTIAIIVKNKNGGVIQDNIVGMIPGASATQGAVYFLMWNRRIQFAAYDYPRPTVLPLAGQASGSVAIDTIAGDDGNFELYFGILEDNVGLRLYRPKTDVTVSTAKVGRNFDFDGPVNFRTSPNAVTPLPGPQDLAMFAHWSVVLTPTQMKTFYAEMKAQYAALGTAL